MFRQFVALVRSEIWQYKPQRGFAIWLLFFVLSSLLFVAVEKMGNVHLLKLDAYLGFLDVALPGVFLLMDMTLLLVMAFLSLEALYGERKQHLLLFWKSLPVRNEVAVASKLFFIAVVLPVVALLAMMLSQWVLMVILSFAFDTPLAVFYSTWQQIDIFALWMNMLSVLVGQSLWYFPVIGWFLLCSVGVPKSQPYIPAFLIPLLLVVVDKVFSLHTGIPQWLEARTPLASPVGITSQGLEAFKNDSTVSLSSLLEFDLWPLLGNQQLWWGLFVGVIFALLAARIRRWRDDAI